MVFWDVQHGSATYLKTPNERHITVDLGIGSHDSGDISFSPLLYLKHRYSVNMLDHVIITHPHKDHINDIMNFDELSPRVLTRPVHLSEDDIMRDVREEDKDLFEKYLEINERYRGQIPEDQNLKSQKNYGGVEFKTFHPSECSKDNLNNHSIVIVARYAGSKIILSGDNENPSWNELLENNDFVESIRDSDILLAPHHGRDSGFHPEVMELINPRLTIVSDGRFVDTSATDIYSSISRGWTVYKRSGGTQKRYCVTTRSDGVVVVKFGYDDGERFIGVGID